VLRGSEESRTLEALGRRSDGVLGLSLEKGVGQISEGCSIGRTWVLRMRDCSRWWKLVMVTNLK